MKWHKSEVERLKTLINEYAGGVRTRFEREADIGKNRTWYALKGGSISSDVLKNIFHTYDISPLWWFTGVGPVNFSDLKILLMPGASNAISKDKDAEQSVTGKDLDTIRNYLDELADITDKIKAVTNKKRMG